MTNFLKKLPLSILVITALTVTCIAEPGPPTTPAAGEFQIRNLKHKNLLRPEDAKSADKTPIVLYPAQNWKCLTWRLEPAAKESFTFKNLFTGKTFAGVTDEDAKTTRVVQVPLPKDASSKPAWQFTKLPDGNYRIVDAGSGQTLTAIKDKDSVLIVLSPWNETDEQKWEVLKAPEHLDM